jgi:hypothetical protein
VGQSVATPLASTGGTDAGARDVQPQQPHDAEATDAGMEEMPDAGIRRKVGERTKSGKLIIFDFGRYEPLPVVLDSDYGFMIFNTEWGAHPKPLYLLASRATGIIEEFDNRKDFWAALARIPRGSVLTQYDKCSAPTWYGLTVDFDTIHRICERHGVKVADTQITCTCGEVSGRGRRRGRADGGSL